MQVGGFRAHSAWHTVSAQWVLCMASCTPLSGPGAAGSSAQQDGLGEEVNTPGIHFCLRVPLSALIPPWEESLETTREDAWNPAPSLLQAWASCSLAGPGPQSLGHSDRYEYEGFPFLAQLLPEAILGLAASAGAHSHL